MRFPTMWYVRPAYAESDQSLYSSLEYSMSVKLLTEHLLEVLSLKGGCTGLSESTLVKMSNYWKSRATAQVYMSIQLKQIYSGEKPCFDRYLSDTVSRSCQTRYEWPTRRHHINSY